MNRRNFITLSSSAAGFIALHGLSSFSSTKKISSKIKIFVLRGVRLEDILEAIKLFELNSFKQIKFGIQTATIQTDSYTHANGFHELVTDIIPQKKIIRTELIDRYKLEEVILDTISNKSKHQLAYLHHTEIAHSSKKMYQQVLRQIVETIWNNFDVRKHKIIITTDIGRNAKTNSMGGMDHSNKTCLDTFALYLGKDTSKMKVSNTPIIHQHLLLQKF